MPVLRVSCVDSLNVLGGFFVSGQGFRLIRAPASLGMASHGTMMESVYKLESSEIGFAIQK